MAANLCALSWHPFCGWFERKPKGTPPMLGTPERRQVRRSCILRWLPLKGFAAEQKGEETSNEETGAKRAECQKHGRLEERSLLGVGGKPIVKPSGKKDCAHSQ